LASQRASSRFSRLADRVLGADRSNRFTILLAALLAAIVVRPFFDHSAAASVLFGIYMAVVLLGGLYAIGIEDRLSARSRKRQQRLGRFAITALLGIIGLVGRFFMRGHPNKIGLLILTLFWLAFLTIISVGILSRTLGERRVTFDTICAALCVYLLIGFAWAFVYSAIDLTDSTAFSFPPAEVISTTTASQVEHAMSTFMYYSFVTLSTIGYGDITPHSPPARALSALEGIVGQFYIAILVATLVGIRISQAMQEEADALRDEQSEKEESVE
jgi:hypothetical protein